MTKFLYAALALCIAMSAAWQPGANAFSGDAVTSTIPYHAPQLVTGARTATFAVG